MEDGRIGGFGRAVGDGVLGHWGQLAAEARAAAARNGCGPPGGTARERSRLVRALSQARILRQASNDTSVRFAMDVCDRNGYCHGRFIQHNFF